MMEDESERQSFPSLKTLTSSDYRNLKNEQMKTVQDLYLPHIESFNFLIEGGLDLAVQDIFPESFELPNGQKVLIYFTGAIVGKPTIPEENVHSKSTKMFPAECRQRGTTYNAKLQVSIQWKVDNQICGNLVKSIAMLPIMVKSKCCSLYGLKPKDLVANHEEAEEGGGYFIINGLEKVVRMLILPRRNYPLALVRASWKKRGPLFTEYGVQIRCVQKDQTGNSMVLHYLTDGTCSLSFSYNKEQFFMPVMLILKALYDTTDLHIYKELTKGEETNIFLKDCVATMLRQVQDKELTSRTKILKYFGERFRVKFSLPECYTDIFVAKFLIRKCICIHLESHVDKFNLLVFMIKKLYALAMEKCAPESADSLMNQELLLGGHFYLMFLKEKLELWLRSLRFALEKDIQKNSHDFSLNINSVLKAMTSCLNLTNQINYLLATGTLRSKSGLGLMQVAGYTVVADKLNYYRYLSHFRCVHRGAFFAQMRTTTVRKLLPETWGFLCPVHTPDGSPCGLLNHLSATCEVVNAQCNTSNFPRLLCSLGMTPLDCPRSQSASSCYHVLLDGKVLGFIEEQWIDVLVKRLRMLKTEQLEQVPKHLEICMVPFTESASQYPGLYLFTTPARMMRSLLNVAVGKPEMIGTFEQVYLDVAIIPEEVYAGITTHMEITQTGFLSAIASLTPYSDFNQSPRNMYQCQMGKQTMGTPCHSIPNRGDNKLYRIQTPQTPLVRPKSHQDYNVDDYPLGTNAVVAVVSYTGYDMEDAMILNKASYERGFAHGTIYKTEIVDLSKHSNNSRNVTLIFGCLPGDKLLASGKLDQDGFPPIGTKLEMGDPCYSYIDLTTGATKVKYYTYMEAAYLDSVKFLGNDCGDGELQRVSLKWRIQRNPIIGDKFSSRHGQKGICSQKWPAENMPFSESGMTPDIIFNPHGFPSRMTIGMMIESMAGKSASMHGLVHDATPFTFSEDVSAIDYFGKMLIEAGYNYHGTERLYSGITGKEFEANIFFGIVYYQRLRHMVSDKYQVRATGPVDILTQQPVQGRKRQGGIRFGEMERDALLAHGTSFLLQDRLMNCSDRSEGHVCVKCGSLLSPIFDKCSTEMAAVSSNRTRKWRCKTCETSEHIKVLSLPYVFRYLVAELGAMNIKVSLDVK
ncbi:DNA-directed RNA polymerase I subunit RPA2-like [Xenia sp. Carnegie-2017]|uniref:DNA-directed RNA polymerase I subunit RPA2-like n=1 Tax=Xenia sp. Carnegie-2017 TaxID=2897299 RepID=UPI001F03C9BC|nr:DNA-directed RNA polymerase I subunit RPA2-like [Xenia sp. Carnegie-2017]